MPIVTKKLFQPVQLGTSLGPVFKLSEGASAIIENMVVRAVNTTGSGVSIEAQVVPAIGSAGNANKIVSVLSILPNDYELVTIPVMANGDQLQMSASAATSISIHHESGMPKFQ